MEFLSSRTPTPVTWGVLNVVVPMAMIVLCVLLIILFDVRQRLEVKPAKTPVDLLSSKPAGDAPAIAQRKRRTYRQRKQARKAGGSAKTVDKTPDVPKGNCEEVVEVESLPMGDCTQRQRDAEIGDTEAPDAEETLFRKDCVHSESDDEEIDAEVGDLVGGSEIQEALTAKAVRAQEGAPAPFADVSIDAMSPKIPQVDGAGRCSCATANAWGCAQRFVYSSNLLLAHRELSIKIAKGPPGLELPETSKAFSFKRTCFATRL